MKGGPSWERPGPLLVACWCDLHVKPVERKLIAKGEHGWSCGKHCRPPDD